MRPAIAYIDGYNLYHGLLHGNSEDCLWLDLGAMVRRFLQAGEAIAAVRYYTAYPRDDPAKLARHMRFVNALREGLGVDVRIGEYGLKSLSCHTCGARWKTFTEKMTDSAIATDLVADANDHAYEVALLVSADRDMIPPVRWVRGRYPKKEIRLLLPPARKGEALAAECSAVHKIHRKQLKACQLPDPVVSAAGVQISKPDEWKTIRVQPRRSHILPLTVRRPVVHVLRRVLVALNARDVID